MRTKRVVCRRSSTLRGILRPPTELKREKFIFIANLSWKISLYLPSSPKVGCENSMFSFKSPLRIDGTTMKKNWKLSAKNLILKGVKYRSRQRVVFGLTGSRSSSNCCQGTLEESFRPRCFDSSNPLPCWAEKSWPCRTQKLLFRRIPKYPGHWVSYSRAQRRIEIRVLEFHLRPFRWTFFESSTDLPSDRLEIACCQAEARTA